LQRAERCQGADVPRRWSAQLLLLEEAKQPWNLSKKPQRQSAKPILGPRAHRAMGSGMSAVASSAAMSMPIPVPEIVERAWRDAPPEREAVARTKYFANFSGYCGSACHRVGA
jgi:hypothetical protein